jgi:cerevisin
MVILQALTTFLALLTAVAGAPSALRSIDRYAGETTGRHIVILKPGALKANLINRISQRHVITHEWDAVMNGFAGQDLMYSLEKGQSD